MVPGELTSSQRWQRNIETSSQSKFHRQLIESYILLFEAIYEIFMMTKEQWRVSRSCHASFRVTRVTIEACCFVVLSRACVEALANANVGKGL